MPKEVVLRYTISDVVKNFSPLEPPVEFLPQTLAFSFWQPRMLDVSCVAIVGIALLLCHPLDSTYIKCGSTVPLYLAGSCEKKNAEYSIIKTKRIKIVSDRLFMQI